MINPNPKRTKIVKMVMQVLCLPGLASRGTDVPTAFVSFSWPLYFAKIKASQNKVIILSMLYCPSKGDCCLPLWKLLMPGSFINFPYIFNSWGGTRSPVRTTLVARRMVLNLAQIPPLISELHLCILAYFCHSCLNHTYIWTGNDNILFFELLI